MPPSASNMSVAEDKENTLSNPLFCTDTNNHRNNAAKNRYSPRSVSPAGSAAKKMPSSASPAMPWRANATAAKGFTKERKPLAEFQTPNNDSDRKPSQEKKQQGDLGERAPDLNPDIPKRRLNAIGSIARGFINRDRPVLRQSFSTNGSLEAPKGCFGFLHSAKPVAKPARPCSPTVPVASRTGAERVRTCDADAEKPKRKETNAGPAPKRSNSLPRSNTQGSKIQEANAGPEAKRRSNSLPRSNSDGSNRLGKRSGGSGWSRDRSFRSSNEETLKRNSGSRSLKSSGEISAKGSRDGGLKGLRDMTVGNSGGGQNPSCRTPKKLPERNCSTKRTASLNGMKKNCGLDSAAVGWKQDEILKLQSAVAGRSSGRDSSKKPRELENDGVSERKRGSSPSAGRRAREIGANLPGSDSPSVMGATPVPAIQATPLQKVHSNYCRHVTPACKLIARERDFSPAHKLIGKYEDFTPAHKLIGKYEDFTPAHKLIGKYGDFTPANKLIGKYGDFTPANKLIGRNGTINPAKTAMEKVGGFTPAPNMARKGDVTPGQNMVGTGGDFTPGQNTVHSTPEQRTQVTPPVQPSISPEIHSQNLDGTEDGQHCFGAGHVMAPVVGKVRDRRKCRPRGILTVGEAKPIPFDENRRFSLIPMPAVASVQWMSPGEAKNLISPENPQPNPSGTIPGLPNLERTPVTGPSPKIPYLQATPSSGFSTESRCLCVTPSSGLSPEVPHLNVTPPSGLTSEIPNVESTPPSGFNPKFPNHCNPSRFTSVIPNHKATSPSGFRPELPFRHGFSPDVTFEGSNPQGTGPFVFSSKIPSQHELNLDIAPQCGASPDVFKPCILKHSPMEEDSCRQKLQVPISSSKDLPQLRISWREGLMSRVFDLREIDCCGWASEGDGEEQADRIEFISEEDHQLDREDDSKLQNHSQFGNNLEFGAPFGSFEYVCESNTDKQDPFPPLASCLHLDKALSNSLARSCTSAASRALDVESIGVDDATTSDDLDWTFCYKNQLFEVA